MKFLNMSFIVAVLLSILFGCVLTGLCEIMNGMATFNARPLSGFSGYYVAVMTNIGIITLQTERQSRMKPTTV